jgi:hypothetical protein
MPCHDLISEVYGTHSIIFEGFDYLFLRVPKGFDGLIAKDSSILSSSRSHLIRV